MKTLALALAASTALLSVPAAAATYNFSYTGTDFVSGDPVTASGTITTTDTTTTVDGRQAYTVTGITGTRNGDTIDQLFPSGTVTDTFGDTSDLFLFVGAPFFTFDGIAFGTAGDDNIYDLYAQSNGSYSEYHYDPNTDDGNRSDLTTFTLTPAAAVPEAASWAMMLMGLGMVGGVMRHRARVSRVTFARA